MSPLPIRENNKIIEVISCDKCKCTWFSKITLNRYLTSPISISQEPLPVHTEADFTVLVCACCGEIVFPGLDGYQTARPSFSLYNEMLKEILVTKEKIEEKTLGSSTKKKVAQNTTWAFIPNSKED